jgi:hypothetical protein
VTTLPLGVCVMGEAAQNAARTCMYPHYIFEILAHAGVFHTRIAAGELDARLDEVRVLVTMGEGKAPEKLRDWVNGGGMWISVGGLCGMEELLGVKRQVNSFANWGGGVRSLGEGYLVPHQPSVMLDHVNRPLHFFGGVAVQSAGAMILATMNDAHGRATGQPVVLEHRVGKGKAVLIAVDVTGTVVYIQQGHGVTRDGVPSPDGTSPVNDGVLKSDDGAVLDWILDREPVPGAEGLSMFAQPVADLWREILLRGIFHLANEAKVNLPVLWYWPRKLPAVGHLSHDTDGNDPSLAQKLLDTLAAGEVTSTWCVILPGYDGGLMAKIKSAGHEYATHYDAMSPGLPFSEAQFDRQFKELKQIFGGEQPVTNKNHYLRWEGDTQLWEWCHKQGIQLDQSKGASKTGEAGFNFGTCHTYFPVRFDGSTIDVLELATPTQDLFVFAPEAIFEPLLAQAKRFHGVLHLLFHPAHFNKPQVPAAMSMAIRRGKEEGLEWWTGRQINAWERARRGVKLLSLDKSSVTLDSQNELQDATVLLSAGPAPASAGLNVWGTTFRTATKTIKGSTKFDLE